MRRLKGPGWEKMCGPSRRFGDITAQIVQSCNMHETGVTGKSEGFGKGDLVS